MRLLMIDEQEKGWGKGKFGNVELMSKSECSRKV